MTGNQASERLNRESRASQARPPSTSEEPRITKLSSGTLRRTDTSPCAVTDLATQCWMGNVNAAPANAQ
jgi:hypothetical protein